MLNDQLIELKGEFSQRLGAHQENISQKHDSENTENFLRTVNYLLDTVTSLRTNLFHLQAEEDLRNGQSTLAEF